MDMGSWSILLIVLKSIWCNIIVIKSCMTWRWSLRSTLKKCCQCIPFRNKWDDIMIQITLYLHPRALWHKMLILGGSEKLHCLKAPSIFTTKPLWGEAYHQPKHGQIMKCNRRLLHLPSYSPRPLACHHLTPLYS